MNKVLLTVGCVLCMAALAIAEVHNDAFSVAMDPTGIVFPGAGDNTGYDNGTWFEYPSGWINQWYYDDPVVPGAWKWIDVLGTIDIYDPFFPGDPAGPGIEEVGWATVAINYTTEAWSPNPNNPPLPGDDENFIVREIIFDQVLEVEWIPDDDPPEPDGLGHHRIGGIRGQRIPLHGNGRRRPQNFARRQ